MLAISLRDKRAQQFSDYFFKVHFEPFYFSKNNLEHFAEKC